MCQFFSALVLKNKILCDLDLDSHEEILKKYNIKDDSLDPDFVRVELTPPNHNFKAPLSEWIFKVDQDLRPDWFEETGARADVEKALKKVLKQRLISSGKKTVKSGRWIVCGHAQVTAHGNTKVFACGSTKVKAHDSAVVEAFGSAQVNAYYSVKVIAHDSVKVTARDSAQVTAHDSVKVTARDSATVIARDSAKVTAHDSAKVTAFDSALVTAHDSAEVHAYESAKVTAFDSAEVKRIK